MAPALDLAPLAAMAVITLVILLLFAYRATVGLLVELTIGVLGAATIHIPGLGHINPFSPIISALNALQNAAYSYLAKLIEADKAIWNRFVQWNAYAWQELSGAVGDVAESAEHAFHTLTHSTIPGAVHGLLAPWETRVGQVEAQVAAEAGKVTSVVTHVTKVVEAHTTIVKPSTIEKVIEVIKAKAVALPQAIANPWPRIRGIDETLKATLDRVNAGLRKLTPAGILGLTLAAVGTLGFDWIRCSNLRKYGPKLCGVKPSVLEDLLLGLTAIFGTLSLVSLAEQMQGLVGELGTEVRHFWRVDVVAAGEQRQLGQTGL